METGVLAIIILIGLAGALAMLARQGTLPWSVPMPKLFGAGDSSHDDRLAASELAIGANSETVSERRITALRAESRPAELPLSALDLNPQPRIESALLNVPAPSPGPLAERLGRLEEQISDVQHGIERQNRDFERLRSELLARSEAADARQEAALERLRADLLAGLARQSAESRGRLADRRSEVSADLFARLARLESALSAVTNPILLPGEDYVPPAELQAEALVWENWNEVGERAFALADAYSAQRLTLSGQTQGEVGRFVTALRLLLTRSVYPNLQAEPDAAQQVALRSALEEIAAELPNVRGSLDREYRSGQAS